MTEPRELSEQEAAERLEQTLQEMEESGIPRSVIEKAVRRAKIKAALKPKDEPPPSRPKLNTNPELDTWYD